MTYELSLAVGLVGALVSVAGFLTMVAALSGRSMTIGAALLLTGAAVVIAAGLSHH